MERSSLVVKDRQVNQVFDFIYQNAFGNPIIFQSEPTNTTMKANTWGIFSTDVYVKFANNVTLKLTGANVA